MRFAPAAPPPCRMVAPDRYLGVSEWIAKRRRQSGGVLAVEEGRPVKMGDGAQAGDGSTRLR